MDHRPQKAPREEKESTRLRDQLSAERRKLPWMKVEKNYVFDTPAGKKTLADLFDGRSQLVIYHFMFGPDWQEGCPSCSFVSDHIDAALPHWRPATSRWSWSRGRRWPRSRRSSNAWAGTSSGCRPRQRLQRDFHVSFTKDEIAKGKVNYNYTMQEFPSAEAPGLSVFCKDADGEIFHTYSAYARGLEPLIGTYTLLDFVPKGRDEDQLGFRMGWLRHHDRYGTDVFLDPTRPYWPPNAPLVSSVSSTCGCGAEAHA